MTRAFFVLDDLPVEDKTIILRVDINSPVNPETGKILGLTRIKSHIQTLEYLNNSRVVILGHQSRPGKEDYISLNEHATQISKLLKRPVTFIDDLIGHYARDAVAAMKNGDVLLLQNVRFYAEELALRNDPLERQANSHIVKNLAQVSDFYVNDAFAAAHRAQPSLVGFTTKLPSAAGLLMEKELTTLNTVLTSGKHPCVAVLGGAKVSDSIEVMENMLKNNITDQILTCGLVGNIFLIAKGYNLGNPNIKFLETEFVDLKELVENAKQLLKKYKNKIETPIDLICNKKGRREVQYLERLPAKYQIYDVGLETVVNYSNILKDAKIIIANGPAGVFEIEEFSFGTNEIFFGIASSKAFSVMGGGETTAVVEKLGIADGIDHISTGGGACINFLAGRILPVVEALKKSKNLFGKKIKKKK
ncbi:phosphoglycerate kinase [[Eubacterium] cellulosolvens]